jgi:hypothetical protein
MDGTSTALTIAIVGVFGTLLAPVVSQRLSARARREEFDQQRLHKHDEYSREKQEANYASKRACYITLSITARRYRVELMNYLHAVDKGAVDDNANQKLQETRTGFWSSVSETELTGSQIVLEPLGRFRVGVTRAYAAIKNLEEGHPEPNGSFEELRAFLFKIWDEWPEVLTAMRADLDVKD